MLVSDSKKHQPEFDLEEARRIYSEVGDDEDIAGTHVTSPFHLFCVEALRDRFGLRVGRAVPTDVFVFGKGELPRPDCTQVGGFPYWPMGRFWPIDESGNPYRFFAQINFADSKDLVGELPGDLLLLFIGDELEWYFHPMEVQFEWVALGSNIQTEFDRSLIANTGGPFYGAIYRTADYPDTEERLNEICVEESHNMPILSGVPDWMTPESRVWSKFQLRWLPILSGTKIGGETSFVQSGEGVSGQVLCQLASIQAAGCVPYPWINRAEPLGLLRQFDANDYDGMTSDPGNEVMFGDMGSIYIFQDSQRQVRSVFESY